MYGISNCSNYPCKVRVNVYVRAKVTSIRDNQANENRLAVVRRANYPQQFIFVFYLQINSSYIFYFFTPIYRY